MQVFLSQLAKLTEMPDYGILGKMEAAVPNSV
jgi:hypothetical protein